MKKNAVSLDISLKEEMLTEGRFYTYSAAVGWKEISGKATDKNIALAIFFQNVADHYREQEKRDRLLKYNKDLSLDIKWYE